MFIMATADDISPLPQDLLAEFTIPHLCGNECHAFLSFHKKDKDTADFIKSELERVGFSILSQDNIEPGQLVFDELDKMIHRCKKVILLITEAYLNDDHSFYQAIMAQVKSNEEQVKVTIPVLHQRVPAEVPAYILEVTYLQSKEEFFWKKLLNAIIKPIPMSALIDTTGIAEGLAWSYFVRYLQLIMPKLSEGMKNRCSDKHYLPIFIVLLPTSGCCRKLHKIDDCIICEEPLPIKQDVGGTKGRDYSVSIVRVRDSCSDEEYCVAAEYATPLQTMFDMTCGQIAGLSEKQRLKEINDFAAALSNMIKSQQFECELYTLVYDDSERNTVSQKILQLIRNRPSAQH